MQRSEHAALFAGQGAQFVGMGRDLAAADPAVMSLFSKANEILGHDLADVCFNGPEEELLKSDNCQVAVFLVGVACAAALYRGLGMQCIVTGPAENEGWARPPPVLAGAAGLSLGEWTALHIAGAISFEDALRALQARGRFMQEACDEKAGAMVSVIGLETGRLRAVAGETGVEIANINSPEQVVLSGERERILEAEKMAASSGAKRTVLLSVAGAYHSSLMNSAAERLKPVLETIQFRAPLTPVISNVTGLPHDSPESIRLNMILQVTSPVQWVATIQWFRQRGVKRYVECGPGRVLSGLVKRIDPGAALCNVQDTASLERAVEALG